MFEVYTNLFVGSDTDYGLLDKMDGNWAVVHCAKEPYHRAALGYEGRGAPKDHPEYLFARRGNELTLNMIDPEDPAYIPLPMVKAAVNFIWAELTRGHKVLVHCNQGQSRGPTVAFLYMARLLGRDYKKAEFVFKERYPMYMPSKGCNEFAQNNWEHFRSLG